MVETIIVFFFGLPAAFLSLLLSVIGVLREKFWLVIVGAVLFIPFSYYLSGSPGLYRISILIPAFQIFSAEAVCEKSRIWAWILLMPSFLAVFWVVGGSPTLSALVNKFRLSNFSTETECLHLQN